MYPVSKSGGRALRYIGRRRRKTIVLALIFFVLCLLFLFGGMIQGGVEASLLELREQFFGSLTVEQSADGEYRVTPETAQEAVEKLAPDGWTGRSVCYLSMKGMNLMPGKFTLEEDPTMYISKFFCGRDSSLMREFTSKEVELLEGRHIQPEDQGKILISEAVAGMNGLKVGDVITGVVTDDSIIHAQAGIGTEYEFEIVGIFQVLKEQTSSVVPAESEIQENMMFVDEAFGFRLEEEVLQEPLHYNMGITLWMKDPAKLEPAAENLKSAGGETDWNNYLIRTNSADYDKSAAPIRQMNMLVRLFILFIFVIGALLLTVLLSMWNRERMPEIGVLLSLGCSKGKVLQQLLWENTALYLAGFAAALPVAAVGSQVLKAAVSVEMGGLTVTGVCLAGVGGLLLCAAVTWISTVWIMRKNPMDILVTVV